MRLVDNPLAAVAAIGVGTTVLAAVVAGILAAVLAVLLQSASPAGVAAVTLAPGTAVAAAITTRSAARRGYADASAALLGLGVVTSTIVIGVVISQLGDGTAGLGALLAAVLGAGGGAGVVFARLRRSP
ncbi:hypothetical protein [Euzebya tangerina]|uniref:hypothetical protein n=1 Tax=Euzebya tangerina TaxID=591198 RepID=UPI000E30C25D|nr:hypothetical protein [Euzebya tangerina]